MLWTPWVEVNPHTAGSLGFDHDTMVWVVSEHGRIRARLKVFPGVAEETVCMPYGLHHADGETANPFLLTDQTSDVLTGLPDWFGSFVRLEPA